MAIEGLTPLEKFEERIITEFAIVDQALLDLVCLLNRNPIGSVPNAECAATS